MSSLNPDADGDYSFDPWARACVEVLAEVPGLRARRMALAPSAGIDWHRARRATTLVFVAEGRLAVQIQRPPFRCVLQPGEIYSVPQGVDMTAFTPPDAPARFCIFEHGEDFVREPSEAPTLAHVGERSASRREVRAGADGGPLPHDAEHSERLVPGLVRMDVVASPPSLRLIVQGHGENECIPFHSHDQITDTFFAVNGQVRVETRDPDAAHVLMPGDSVAVPAGVAHRVSGNAGQPCEMLILQGVGRYNYVER